MDKTRVNYGGRAFRQDAQHAVKRDIVRGLIEAITNSDDAYGDKNGKIRVEVERRRQDPWRAVISVRDRATGMRAAKMKDAIGTLGGRTSGFEEGHNVRGNLGRGAKDLAAFGPVTFESICDGFYSAMTLEEDGSYETPVERKAQEEDYANLRIKKKRNASGTVVTIHVRKIFPVPQHEKLLEKLSNHYQLRDITSDPQRELTLQDVNTNREGAIRYDMPPLEVVDATEIEIEGYPGAKARVTIRRTDQCYDNTSDPGRPAGLLIVGRRAIYDNTLFRFERSPYGGWFSGRVECPYIDELARQFDEDFEAGGEGSESNPIPIIARDRDGLVEEHPFVKALALAVEFRLGPLIRTEEKLAQNGAVRESARLRRALDDLGRDLGKLIDDDLKELDEEGLKGKTDGEFDFLMQIRPPAVVMYMGEDKTISVVVARRLGVNEIDAECDPEGVIDLPNGYSAVLEDHPNRPDYLIGRFRLHPLREDEETHFRVRAGGEEAGAFVDVRSERIIPDPEPPETFRFERPSYSMTKGKRRRLKLQAPLEVVNQTGSQVRVTSSTDGIAVLHGGQVELIFDEDLLFYAGAVEVDPRRIGASGELRANLEGLHAKCAVTVGDAGSGAQIEFEIANRAAGKFRAEVTQRENGSTRMTIFAGHPVLRRYLGPAPEFPHLDTPMAKSVLAEIIASECARIVVERKHSSATELDGAGFYSEHRNYLEKYLLRCHKMMAESEISTDQT